MSATELFGEQFAPRVDEAIEACQFSGVVRVDEGDRCRARARQRVSPIVAGRSR